MYKRVKNTMASCPFESINISERKLTFTNDVSYVHWLRLTLGILYQQSSCLCLSAVIGVQGSNRLLRLRLSSNLGEDMLVDSSP